MAFFGDFGKIFLGGASTGNVVGAITGNPVLAASAQRGADLLGRVPTRMSTQQGQATARSVSPKQPVALEDANSGNVTNNIIGMSDMAGGGFENVFSQAPARSLAQNANLGALAQRGVQALGGFGGLFGLGAGLAAPMIFDALTGETKRLRVTRKLKSDTKRAVELLGIEVVADRMQIGVEGVMYILNRKMRNDGPMVTKAAVRKTRTTIRKMKGVVDLYDSLRPAAKRRTTATRMTPAARAAKAIQIT